MSTDKQLLTLQEAAQELRIGRTLVWQLVSKGELPAYRLGTRALRIHRRDLEAYLESCRWEGKRDRD